MRTRIPSLCIAISALSCLAVGCLNNASVEGATVEVSVSGKSPDITLLRVRAILDGRPGIPDGQTIPSDAGALLVRLPADKTGELFLQLEGLTGASCVRAAGSGNQRIFGPGHYQMAVLLYGHPGGCLVPSGSSSELRGVWGSGPGDIWAVGNNGATLHWNGFTWAAVPSGTFKTLHGVWGSGLDDVWAVGCGGYEAIIEHFNGSTWTPVHLDAEKCLFSVWGSAPNDVWAVGTDILHWNGATWAPAAEKPRIKLWSVWGSGPNDVWAVGGIEENSGVIYHFDGVKWSEVLSGLSGLGGVWGSGPDDVWVVGRPYFSPDSIYHFDGVLFSPFSHEVAGADSFLGVWGSGQTDIWAVGEAGSMLRWDGVNSASIQSGADADLLGVWGSGPDDVWAVGAGGIYHWNGVIWGRGD